MLEKPLNPRFSSGPTTKHPGWSLGNLRTDSLGRSHRQDLGVERIQEVLSLIRGVLNIPHNYQIALVPGSCTGAMEMALWSLLGLRDVDVFSWGVFGNLWFNDIRDQLSTLKHHVYKADDGYLPDTSQYDPDHDCVFVWNETTTGVKVPHGQWIPEDRKGLTICDATSATFAMDLEWSRLDATAFSWQKSLGGEGGHGILVLSPCAVERLESYTPPWPMPRIFRMTKKGKLLTPLFEGKTINSPSLLCVEDVIDALKWCRQIGGLSALIERSEANLACFSEWVKQTSWLSFRAEERESLSSTSICLKLLDVPQQSQWDVIGRMTSLLSAENVAYDIRGHRLAAPNLRIWGGPTVEKEDIQKLLPWLEWAYEKSK